MPNFFSIGEALIDFIPIDVDVDLKDVSGFIKKPGGAPANVAGAVSMLYGSSYFIGKLGKDAFGDYIKEVLQSVGVDTSYIYQTKRANTCLAFVSLKSDGNREFAFYRKPSADLLLESEEINEDWFENGDILQFCSVSLVAEPVRSAHKRAIEIVRKKKGYVFFDPNLRFSLWEDKNYLKDTCLEFLENVDLVKISDEEIEFITGSRDEKKASAFLFNRGVKIFVYTMGKEGAKIITPEFSVFSPAFKINAIDTTGAGDAFLGALSSRLLLNRKSIFNIDKKYALELLHFSNAAGAIVSLKKGAITSMPSLAEINAFLNNNP